MDTATGAPEIGLRERKAARLKLTLVDLLTEELKRRPFHEISVEALCGKALISKMTFFNYFPAKDALLWYHASVWIYRLKADTRLAGLEGVSALRFLYEDMARNFNECRNLFSYFFSVNSQQMEGVDRPELGAAERLELYPDGSTMEFEINASLGEFLMEHTQHARRLGEMRTDMPVEGQAVLLGSAWHGSGLVGLRVSRERPGDTYLTNFDTLIQLLAP